MHGFDGGLPSYEQERGGKFLASVTSAELYGTPGVYIISVELFIDVYVSVTFIGDIMIEGIRIRSVWCPSSHCSYRIQRRCVFF